MKKKITGVILAGGENRRMGTEKGLLKIGGISFVEKIVEVLSPMVAEIIIISNGNKYDYLGYKIYSDIKKDCGPMGGIFSALTFSASEKNFIVSCDMPFICKELVTLIIENSGDCEIAIPVNGKITEPLCAVYDKSCKNKMEQLLDAKKLKLNAALKFFDINKVVIPEKFLESNCFTNINTPDEYEKLKLNYHEYSN